MWGLRPCSNILRWTLFDRRCTTVVAPTIAQHNPPVLITGVAGLVGSHLAEALLAQGRVVV
ncbi:MAG: NAD-dependent epimerase/dehydratase family protein, partial [Planctomycetota bacterium]